MADNSASKKSRRSNFRQFFLRGLAILLPTILTIWILVAVYNFVDQKIAKPINTGVRVLVVRLTPWPKATDKDFAAAEERLTAEDKAEWKILEEQFSAAYGPEWPQARNAERREWLEPMARQAALKRWWDSVSVGEWAVLDLIGLIIAAVLIYMVGVLLGGYLGRRIVAKAEDKLRQVPGFRQVYPYVKQVTDFLVGDNAEKVQFNRVVAVEYPRKGLWSIGLVTGNTLQTIRDHAEKECVTVFVPSSPTPFTGYVITVPVEDTIELSITIEEALRFSISGGVIVPPNQVIPEAGEKPKAMLPAEAAQSRESGT